jgi:hypothetical protein
MSSPVPPIPPREAIADVRVRAPTRGNRRLELLLEAVNSSDHVKALWHVSAVALPTGFDLPARQIPIFLLNAAVMGAIWGVLRQLSGSIIVSSVSHGIWNGIAYALFGYGTRRGALGVSNTALYGPEVGLLGLGLNVLALCVLLTVVLATIARTRNNTEPNPNTKYFSSWRDADVAPSEVKRQVRPTSRRRR